VTDIHVMDVQSPARFEFFDSYGSLPIPGLSIDCRRALSVVAQGFDVPLALAIVVALEQMELEGRRR